MRKILALVACLTLLAGSEALATDLSFSRGISQGDFKELSKNLGALLTYKNTAPAEPLGITGFDIGVEASGMSIGHGYWDAAFKGNAPSFIAVPKVRVRKGLPFGIDVGGSYSYVPDSNIKLWGAEVSYAILDGGVALPAVGVRGTYTSLSGVSVLDFSTMGLDASISKGILFITPYAGAGLARIDSKAKGQIVTSPLFIAANGGIPLKEEKFWQPRYFAGLKLSPFPLFGITAEAEYSTRAVYSLKAAFAF